MGTKSRRGFTLEKMGINLKKDMQAICNYSNIKDIYKKIMFAISKKERETPVENGI